MKKILYLILFIPITSSGQVTCNLSDQLEHIFLLNKYGNADQVYLVKESNVSSVNVCLPEYYKNNKGFFDYLLINYSNVEMNLFKDKKDSISIQNTFSEALKKDTNFRRTISEFDSLIIFKNKEKDTITWNRLFGIGAKFFIIPRLTRQGYYMAQICVGTNTYLNTESDRLPLVEAFCFVTIFEHLEDGEYNLQNEMIKAVKKLYSVNMGNNDEEKLLRAQGALFMLMFENEALRNCLRNAYSKNYSYMPFILVD